MIEHRIWCVSHLDDRAKAVFKWSATADLTQQQASSRTYAAKAAMKKLLQDGLTSEEKKTMRTLSDSEPVNAPGADAHSAMQ